MRLLISKLLESQPARRTANWIIGCSGLAELRINKNKRDLKIPVLTYHSIAENSRKQYRSCLDIMGMEVTAEQFRKHLTYIAAHFQTITMAALADGIKNGTKLPPNALVLTFDDGYRDNAELAAPLLKGFGVKATFFLIGNCALTGKPSWLHLLYRAFDELSGKTVFLNGSGIPDINGLVLTDKNKFRVLCSIRATGFQADSNKRNTILAQLCLQNGLDPESISRRDPFLTQPDIRQLLSEGHEIGAHSMNHLPLSSMSFAQQREEISASRTVLSSICGSRIRGFSYPFGVTPSINGCATAIVKESGFDYAVTTEPLLVHSGTDLYKTGRLTVKNHTLSELKALIARSF